MMFRASLSRLLLGFVALLLLPALYPATGAIRGVLVGYLVFAAVELVLIRRAIGGMTRSFVASLIDLAAITLIVHRLGSVSTPLIALYFFSGMLNSLVVSLRVGVAHAFIGAFTYCGVLLAENRGWLAYAVDVPERAGRAPSMSELVPAAGLTSLMMFTTALIVGMLVRSLRAREDALTTANARLEELSRRDPLTGLFNRRHLIERIEEALAFARRGRAIALLMFDLDGFKRVNDAQGHLRGDQLLHEIGLALLGSTRGTDVVARFGGDEFVVLLFDADAAHAEAAAARIVEAVREVGERFGHGKATVTASVGLAAARADDTPASLLRRADETSYRAKQSGGDRVVLAA
jgi:diguanylate cyclase (GGDEF)-like protein